MINQSIEQLAGCQGIIQPSKTPIITQNVPFTQDSKHISKTYVMVNLIHSFLTAGTIVGASYKWISQLTLYLAIGVIFAFHLIYLAVAYRCSGLIFLTKLHKLSEFSTIFQQLKEAESRLVFYYNPPKHRIDDVAHKIQKPCEIISLFDKSGTLYEIDPPNNLVLVKYTKKFYFQDEQTKQKVENQLKKFAKNCEKMQQKKKDILLSSKWGLQMKIQGFSQQLGFIKEKGKQQQLFWITLLIGIGAYYQLCTNKRIFTYSLDIVKEVCLK